MAPSIDIEDAGRSAQKRRAIIDAATTTFLAEGFLGASMDEIAARASVSKQTVYKHYADKRQLFCEVVIAAVREVSDPVHAEVQKLADSGDPEADLRDVARRQLELVMQPRLMRLRRLVIAEAPRFPELGRTFHEQGPGRTISAIAEALTQLSARGALEIDDVTLAATQFNWLVMAAPVNEAMLLGFEKRPDAATLDHWATTGVRTFMAAYGVRSPRKRSR